MPQTPLVGMHVYACKSMLSLATIILLPSCSLPPPNSKSCMKPWFCSKVYTSFSTCKNVTREYVTFNVHLVTLSQKENSKFQQVAFGSLIHEVCTSCTQLCSGGRFIGVACTIRCSLINSEDIYNCRCDSKSQACDNLLLE